MKQTKVEVPAVAWWVLAGLVIPVLQVWIEQTFPGTVYVWAPLAVGALGAILKWISWVMEQNSQPVPFEGGDDDEDGGDILAPASLVVTEEYVALERPHKAFDPVEFLFGIKRG